MVKNCGQDEIQEGQEEKDEDDGGGAGDANHGTPGKWGWRQQQGGLHSQSAGLWQGESVASRGDALQDMTHPLALIWAVNLQEDSDLENYMTSVQEDMMEFKLSYEMWRVGRWAVSIPQVSYKYSGYDQECPAVCYRSSEAASGRRVHVWVCVVGRLGGGWADLHRTPGGGGEPRKPAMGHQEDLHGRHLLPKQVAGKRLHIVEVLEIVRFFSWTLCFVFFVQDSTSLPSITELESELEVKDKVTEDTRVSVEHFLQVRRLNENIKTLREPTSFRV